MRPALLALAMLLCIVAPGPALAQADEVIVTAARYSDTYDELTIPHVFTERRADYVIIELEVRSDTRDVAVRREEMRSALRGLESRAREGGVTLVLADEESGRVRSFSMGAAEELIRVDRRPDTSTVTIRLRTPVAAGDTLESINARMDRFVEAAPKPGRIEMELGDSDLTLLDPEQYRAALLGAIAEDGRNIAARLGADYGVVITHLERQVVWRRTGDLELALFVSYELGVSPRPHP